MPTTQRCKCDGTSALQIHVDFLFCRSDSVCGFASVGPAEYTGGRVTNQNFQVGYIGGDFATGTVGREDITFAGLTVRNQHLGLADIAHVENPYGLTSGIMGEFGLN